MVSTEVEARELARLKKMMRNPAYWRDRDPAIVKIVTQGFEDLYDDPEERDDLEDLSDARQGQMANILGLNGKRNKEDTYIAHLTPGEIVVPLSAQTDQVMALLSQTLGEDLPTYTVGSGKEQINPESGLPAFADNWFQKTEKPENNPSDSDELKENTNLSINSYEMQGEQPDQSDNQLCFRLNVKLNEEKGKLDLLERKVKNLCTNAAAKCKQYEAQETNEVAKAGFTAGAATFTTLGSLSSSAALAGMAAAVSTLLGAVAISQFWRAVDRYFNPLDQQVKDLETKISQQKINIKTAEANIQSEGCKVETIPPITFR